MTSKTKWPDFRLASTLWSLVGSEPNNAQEKERPAHDTDNQTAIGERATNSFTALNHRREAPYTMTDAAGRPIDGLGGFDGFEDDAHIDNVDGEVPDEDFGAIEMFDSNASQPVFSSQVNETAFGQSSKAPEAVMFEEPPASQPRKSKRDKKERKKKGSHEASSSPQPQIEEDSLRKGRKARRRSQLSEEIEGHSAPPASAPDEAAISATQGKRKRKSSDTGEAKQRKKRKSRDRVLEVASQDVVEDTQDNTSQEATSGVTNTDLQVSPSVARARRRSHSHDPRSREYSVPLVSQGDEMDVDNSIPSGQGAEFLGSQELGSATYGQHIAQGAEQTDADVESLAREAWNEHVNGQAQLEANGSTEAANESAVLDPEEHVANDNVYDIPKSPPHDPQPPSAQSKRTRSVRAKKAKPTYFEKSPSPEKQENASGELPSPSAMTPAPRKRAKKATKTTKAPKGKARKAKAEPLSQPDDDAAQGDDEEGGSRRRRARTTGFTQGRFSEDELTRIAKAVEGFRSESGLTQQQVNALIHAPGGTQAGEEVAALWVRIFSLCPDRHRQKIINTTRKKFHNFVARGTWTVEQDSELRDLIEVHGTKWAEIAAIINRHPEDLRDRYRNYIVCGDAQRKDSWDEAEEQRLAQYIMEAMTAIDELRTMQPSRELLKKSYEELIDWQNISERMERTRSRLQCITKWKAMNIKTHGKDKLASKEPNSGMSWSLEKARRQIRDMPEEERYRLLLTIQGSGALVESKIPWPKMVDKKFRNSWHRTTQMLLWRRLKHTVPDWEKKTVRDCAQYLIDQYSQAGDLPEIKDEDHELSQEMEFFQSLPSTGPIAHASTQNGHRSAEFVTESDNEGDQEMKDEPAPGVNDPSAIPDENINPDLPIEPVVDPDLLPPIDDEILIDPAPEVPELLIEPELPIEAELPEPTPPKATKVAKRTYGKKKTARTTTPARKRAAAKKNTPGPSQDPIEDVAEVPTQPEPTQKDNSDIDEEQYRKRKTPSKFRTASAQAAAPPSDASDSVMDDMEDLPARIPA